MTSKPSLRSWTALGATLLIAVSLAACGDDEPVTTASSSSSPEDTTVREAVADTSEPIRSNVKTGPLRVTDVGTEQFRDVDFYTTLEHGKESSKKVLEQGARVVHGYLVAHVQYDWARACSYLSERALESVTNIGSQFEEVAGEDCPTIIAHLLGKVPARKTFVSSEVNAGVFRVRREGGYLFYRAGGDPYTVGLNRDDEGNWKLASFVINEIAPPPS